VELLKQPQYEPRSMVDQVIAIFAGTQGYFDTIAVGDVARAEKELLTFKKDKKSDLRNKIVQTGALDDATIAELRRALDEFLKQAETTGHKMVAAS
jgi:F-type H+-transporting ATPase subunit alpha